MTGVPFERLWDYPEAEWAEFMNQAERIAKDRARQTKAEANKARARQALHKALRG